jgi:hypothetical protein
MNYQVHCTVQQCWQTRLCTARIENTRTTKLIVFNLISSINLNPTGLSQIWLTLVHWQNAPKSLLYWPTLKLWVPPHTSIVLFHKITSLKISWFICIKTLFMICVQNCESDLTFPCRNTVFFVAAVSVSRIRPSLVEIFSLCPPPLTACRQQG